MVFCGNLQRDYPKFARLGFQQHDMPALTEDPQTFVDSIGTNLWQPAAEPNTAAESPKTNLDLYNQQLKAWARDFSSFIQMFGHLLDNPYQMLHSS
jgi:hypothetical protein